MQNKQTKKTPEQETATFETKPKSYYPNLEYNKSKKIKFFSLFVLLVVCMGLFIGAMAARSEWMGIVLVAVLLLFMGMLLPSVIKGYPTKPGVPEITISGHDVTARNKEIRANDIEKVVATVLLNPVSKVKSENEAFVKEIASTFPEEPCFGTLDIYLKPGPKVKKGETIYLTVDDVLSATVDLVNAGVKHYNIFFSLKKIYAQAGFSLTKNEKKTAKLSDVSEKERRKQIL